MDPQAPSIDGIEIVELLGGGGMSLVYKARQEKLDRLVAVKVLSAKGKSGEAALKRFTREARLTTTLVHPNIVKVISFGVCLEGMPYLVMEYLDGLSLAQELKENGRLSLQKFRDVFLPVLSALGHAHESGVIHRDIKPANIMICRGESGTGTVKLVDFGIARVFAQDENASENLTGSAVLLGTPAYMSPEQCRGETLDARSDLYSLACVMYEALCGEPPFSGDSPLDVMQKHSRQAAPALADLRARIDIDARLASAVLSPLAKDPGLRPQTASQLSTRLSEALDRLTLERIPGLKSQSRLPSRQAAFIIAGFVLILALSLAILAAKPDLLVSCFKHASNEIEPVRPSRKEESRLWWGRKLKLQSPEYAKSRKGVESDILFAKANRLLMQHKYAEALPLLKQMLSLREEVLGPDNPELDVAMLALARDLNNLNRFAEAEQVLRRSLTILEKHQPDPGSMIPTLFVLSVSCGLQDKYAESEQYYRRALAAREKLVELRQKEHPAAESFMKYGLGPTIKTTILKLDAPQVPELIWLANYYLAHNKLSESEKLYRCLLTAEEKTPGKSAELVEILNGLSQCCHWQGKAAEEKLYLKRARDVQANITAEHPESD